MRANVEEEFPQCSIVVHNVFLHISEKVLVSFLYVHCVTTHSITQHNVFIQSFHNAMKGVYL